MTADLQGDVLRIVAENANAGHRLPSGDPERWVQITATFYDADNQALSEPWTHRIGQEWTWYPEPVKHGDNRLAPRERRTLEVPVPSATVRVAVTGSSHRMSPETRDYHELGDYPVSVQTHQIELRP